MRETEALVRKLGAPDKAAPLRRLPPAPTSPGSSTSSTACFEAPVAIRSGKRGGKIQISFRDQAELERLVALLRSLAR